MGQYEEDQKVIAVRYAINAVYAYDDRYDIDSFQLKPCPNIDYETPTTKCRFTGARTCLSQ